MKKTTWIFIGFLAIAWLACNNNSVTSEQEETTPTTVVESNVTPKAEATALETDAETTETNSDADATGGGGTATHKESVEEKITTTVKKEVKDKTSKVVEDVKETSSKAKESSKKIVETVKETVTNTPVVEKPKEVVKETVEKVVSTPKPIIKTEIPPKPKEETKSAQEPEMSTEMPPTPTKPALSHSKWDGLLQKHVSSSGKVNYAGFKADKAQLQSYLEILSANTPESSWSKSKTMAYWINAYNAFTVKLIVDNYPVSSITDLEGGDPWKKRWISLGNQTYTLNQIEKDILLKKYGDARVHFAVNCAAKSCPALLNQAWTASNLESNFEKQSKAFINNSKFNEISPKSAKLSQLFNWYASDFGDVKTFINKYATTQLKSNAKIDFLEYDWKLNN